MNRYKFLAILTSLAVIAYTISFMMWHIDMIPTFEMYILTIIFAGFIVISSGIFCLTSNRSMRKTNECTTANTDECTTDNSLNRWL